MPSSPSSKPAQIYVARFSRRTREEDLEKAFEKFGRIKDLTMKNGYAFIEFEDKRDAEDAVDEMDGKHIDGERIIVEHAGAKRGDRGRPSTRGPQAGDVCFNCNKSGHWANECREERVSRNTRDGRDGRCFKCGRTGHKQRDCRERSSSRSPSRDRSGSRDRKKRRHRSPSSSRSPSGSRSNTRRDRNEKRRSPRRSRTPERKRRSPSSERRSHSPARREDKPSRRSESEERKTGDNGTVENK